jgi:DNA-3-methyladenine glycosylase
LLGKYLVIKKWAKEIAYMITEVEAYDGEEDQACHARFGKTRRNAPMFGPPGCWYIYLCYGMYWMLNIVTGPGNYPSAALIRAVQSAEWGVTRKKRKLVTSNTSHVTVLNWPWKITKTLHIDKKYNAKPASRKTWLWIEDRGVIVKKYTTTKRKGIDYAGEWADKKWNFKLKK